MKQSVKLSEPGKGLPFPENLIARFIFIPMAFRRLSVERSIDLFIGEGQECLRLARTITREEQNKPILIKRFIGIEDNSRNWSVSMVIRHLLIVGPNILHTSKSLSKGIVPEQAIKIQDTKPSTNVSSETLAQYDNFLNTYRQQTEHLQYPDLPTIEHPWFGQLNTAQWLKLNALHNRIHRKHIEAILQDLTG